MTLKGSSAHTLAHAKPGMLPALWLGLAAGLLEVGIRAIQHFGFGRLLFVGADFWWGAPLVNTALIAGATVLICLPFARTRFGPRLWLALPLGLATLGLLLLIPRIAGWAVALLAAGIAVQGSAWLEGRRTRCLGLARRTLPILLLVPAVLGAIRAWQRVRHTEPAQPLRLADDTPNVLLLVLDTVRAMELGLYGGKPSPSPNLDAIGAQGAVFDQAYSAAPWTAPSHASFFTGHRAHELSIDWQRRLDRRFPTLAEVLGAAGYATLGMVANTEYASAETGLDRGFARYDDYALSGAQALRWTALAQGAVALWRRLRHPAPGDYPGRIAAAELNHRLLRWLDGRSAERPWFAFLNYFDAHAPYYPPEPFWSRWLPDQPRRPRIVVPGSWSPQVVGTSRRAYEAAIAYLEQQLGALLDSLRVRRSLANTLVVVVGDHGEEFHEHGLMGHGNSLYAPSVHVPLIVLWPGHVPARRIADPVSLSALPATILELLGRSSPFPGPGLGRYWRGEPAAPVAVVASVSFARNLPKWYPVSHGGMASARLGRYRYLWSPGDTLGLLYDEESDPLETRNLVQEPGVTGILRALRDTVRSIIAKRP